PEPEPEVEGPPTAIRTWKLGKEDSGRSGKVRDELAFASKEAEVKGLFAAAGVAFPPRRALFRVFKEEKELEVWASDAADGPLKPITTYRICAASGGPGPKTRTGDGQVPEGFYEIDFFKPRSDYYLALHVNYPNRRDRAQRSTGSAIMIHGRCASIGCLAMSDDRIQELWVIGKSLRSGRVQVHIFPERAIDGLVAKTEHAGLRAFWASLAEGKRRFDADHRVPKKIGFDDDGNYTFD
ncbi:MAG: L,D-transpeptidase family protein, partial [Myxococcales bacterium]|nr:L,D-transpeptidase family protein [Myxococcales bacterium]